MIGILADNNAIGQVTYLVQQMQAPPWAAFWQALGLVQKRFTDLGLTAVSSDLEIWHSSFSLFLSPLAKGHSDG